jgi:tetratricopeptide (TPR) repeat protein
MAENIFPLNIRGDQGNPGVAPCIIKEVYFPPESPQEVATLVESALVYQCDSNFEMAVDCYEKARETWMKVLKLRDSSVKALKRPEHEMFFCLSVGSVYESAGKDDLALSQYMKAKDVQLQSNHPDRAFPFCGLGSVLYHMEEPAWALRLFLKAREVREQTIGGDTVDTATVYNNLGCCMFMLERNQEAKAYFELANAIFECELGYEHERTLTTKRNLKKVERSVLDI